MKKKNLTLLVVASILFSLSCSWFTPSAPAQPSDSGPADNFLDDIVAQNTPAQEPAAPAVENDTITVQTDPDGRASVSDPAANATRNILVKDSQTSLGIGNIELTYVSDGADFIVIAVDPSGTYLPMLYDPESQARTGGAKLARPSEQGITEIVILLSVLSAIQTVEDLIQLYNHPPRLEKWGWNYVDSCWTGEQMGQYAGAAFSSASMFLGVPGFDDIGAAVFKIADQALLDMLKIAQMGAEYEGQQRLQQFDGILRWRLFNTPFLTIITPRGYCLDSLDVANARSVVDWVNYALQYNEVMPLERLAASQMGYVNYIEGGQGISRAEFLRDMKERLPGGPVCEGYAESDSQIQVWTRNWSPPLTITELCYAGCSPINPPWESEQAAFLFFRDDNGAWELSKLWLNEPSPYSTADGAGLIGCDHESPASLQIQSASPTPTDGAGCPGALESRLTVGEYAYVIPEPPLPNRVRSGPGRQNKAIGEAQPGEAMTILSGPRCADGWAWWEVKVANSGLTGWTAEGDAGEYWLAPCSSLAACHDR